MISLEHFLRNFNGFTPPVELVGLLDFQNNILRDNFYTSGFELIVETEKFGLKTYSEDINFLNSILEFANADATGSTYAFWLKDNNKNLSETPIVVFGSEGGFHIVANNIHSLFRILTYDSEAIVSWEKVVFYRDEADCVPSKYASKFQKWLKDNFNIDPTRNANEIVKESQKEFQEEFHDWMKQYCSII